MGLDPFGLMGLGLCPSALFELGLGLGLGLICLLSLNWVGLNILNYSNLIKNIIVTIFVVMM